MPTEKVIPKLGDPLTDREARTVRLMAVGLTDGKITTQLNIDAARAGEVLKRPFTKNDVLKLIAAAKVKTGCAGRIGLVLWMADHAPDEVRAEWTKAAQNRLTQLRASGLLKVQGRIPLLMLLTDPAHCDKPHAELGRLCEPPLSLTKVTQAFGLATANIGENGCLEKLALVLKLAPLVIGRPEGADDESDEPTL